jgi:hypothetical protein
MKKCLILCLFILHFFNIRAQNFQGYSDATSVGGGFSYNVQISITPAGKTALESAGVFKVKLISINADSKGYYSQGKTNRYYSCSELGSVCNPDRYEGIFVGINYQCDNSGLQQVRFSRINEEKLITLWSKPNTTCSFQLKNVLVTTANGLAYKTRIREIEYPPQSVSNNSLSSQSNQSSSNPMQTRTSGSTDVVINGNSNTTSGNSQTAPAERKPWLIDPATLTQTPSNSGSKDSFSKTVDDVSTAVTLTNAVIDLFGGNKKQKSVEEMLAEDGINPDGTLMADQLKAEAAAANEAAAERERENEKSRRETARLAREAIISSRTAVISPFSTGKIPRTVASDVKKLYFFYSSYVQSSLSGGSFDLYISNIFTVQPYGDGTWPFTEQLLSDLAKINPSHTIALAGEFTTIERAEERLATLKQSATSAGMTIRETKFAGKNTGDGQADFWGTPVNTTPKKATANTPAKEKPQSDADYWGVGSVTSVSAPVINPTTARSKTTPVKKGATAKKAIPAAKTNAETKTVEVDYWGNPVKN